MDAESVGWECKRIRYRDVPVSLEGTSPWTGEGRTKQEQLSRMPEATEGNNLCPCEHRSGHPWPRLLVPDAVYLVRPCTRLTVYMHAFVASHFLVLSRHKHIPVQKKGEPKLPSLSLLLLPLFCCQVLHRANRTVSIHSHPFVNGISAMSSVGKMFCSPIWS